MKKILRFFQMVFNKTMTLIFYGVPNGEAKHIDWSEEVEPTNKPKVRTTDEYEGLTPIQRQIELYKDQIQKPE